MRYLCSMNSIVAIALCIGLATHPQARSQNADKPHAESSWAGVWTRTETPNEGAGLTISQATPSGFHFEIQAASGMNTGELSGDAQIAGARATFVDNATKCKMEFVMADGIITIPQGTCDSYAGMGVYFNGNYGKAMSVKEEKRTDKVAEQLPEQSKQSDKSGGGFTFADVSLGDNVENVIQKLDKGGYLTKASSNGVEKSMEKRALTVADLSREGDPFNTADDDDFKNCSQPLFYLKIELESPLKEVQFYFTIPNVIKGMAPAEARKMLGEARLLGYLVDLDSEAAMKEPDPIDGNPFYKRLMGKYGKPVLKQVPDDTLNGLDGDILCTHSYPLQAYWKANGEQLLFAVKKTTNNSAALQKMGGLGELAALAPAIEYRFLVIYQDAAALAAIKQPLQVKREASENEKAVQDNSNKQKALGAF